jgi:hypothetical protein
MLNKMRTGFSDKFALVLDLETEPGFSTVLLSRIARES